MTDNDRGKDKERRNLDAAKSEFKRIKKLKAVWRGDVKETFQRSNRSFDRSGSGNSSS